MIFALGFHITPATGLTPGIIEWFRRQRSFSSQSMAIILPSDHRIYLTSFSVLPGIAFSLDLIETTGRYGVAEVLLSSAMAAGVFSVFGGQPLCIAGVTGAFSGVDGPILRHSPSHHRSYYRVEQDDLRYSGQDLRRSGLPAVYGMGILLGCDIPLDIGSSEL